MKNFRLSIDMCCVSIGIFFIALYVVTTKEHFGESKEENEVNTYVHCITFINFYFIDYFTGDSSYIYETANFFIREGKLCFLAEPFPSINQLTILEMDIDGALKRWSCMEQCERGTI